MPQRRKKRATAATKSPLYNSALTHVGINLALATLHLLRRKGLLDKDDLSELSHAALSTLEKTESEVTAADRAVFSAARQLMEKCLASLD